MAARAAIYLDHQATTPVDPRVLDAMLPFLREKFGNAASTSHAYGWVAEEAVARAREQVAALIGASPSEIVFVSGATEANNLALLGAARAYGLPPHLAGLVARGGALPESLRGIDPAERGHRLVSVVTEHKAVLDPLAALARDGFEVELLPVSAEGLVDVARFVEALRPKTFLASVMAANNEIGVLQPIDELGAIARSRGVLFHTDAAQAFGKIPIDVARQPIDLMSMSAHKLYGPKGVGALYVRRKDPRVALEPIVFGGGHERGLRSGTLDVPAIVGFGAACEIARAEMSEEAARLRALRDRLLEGVRAKLTHVELNGALEPRLPGNLSLAFLHVEGEALMHALREVALSSGSACTSASRAPSHVLAALGRGHGHHTIRFGLGRSTTAEQIDRVVELLATKVQELRRSSASWAAVEAEATSDRSRWR